MTLAPPSTIRDRIWYISIACMRDCSGTRPPYANAVSQMKPTLPEAPTIIRKLCVMHIRNRLQRTSSLFRGAPAYYQRPSTSPSTCIFEKLALAFEIQNSEPWIKYHRQGLCIRLFPGRKVAGWSVVQSCGRCRGPYGLLSCGLSFNTVLMPTRIASCIERILIWAT
jgi:hypothetical protein